MSELIQFLQEIFQVLEAIENAHGLHEKFNNKSQISNVKSKWRNKNGNQNETVINATTTKIKCYVCKKGHAIYRYPQFLAMSVNERQQEVTKLKICEICLSQHAENKCKFNGCHKCGKKHNTLLHEQNDISSLPETAVSTHAIRKDQSQILLSTAII